jgi:hypothetical protein
LLIPRTLLLGPAQGHTIAKTIAFNSEDVLQVEQGSLYPGPAPSDQAEMDFGRRRHVGEQSAGQVLPADAEGTAAIDG